MDPHWTNGTATLYRADARTIPLPDNSVHCVVTSPPYFGLRNYGLTNWTGGDPDCLHSPGPEKAANEQPKQPVQCKQCRARKEDLGIGNESTLQEYVDSVVQVFREIWRVLRDDGTCWVNLGDSYANDGKWGGATGGRHAQGLHGRTGVGRTKTRTGLKPKNLMMAPARIAIALQDDGWVVRQRVIWHKTRNTPEAVEDRPVSTNEDIYFLAKSCDPLFWTHRELPGTRTEPEPDYRWTDLITGVEYDREPADYSSSETGELVECPDCLGQGEMDAGETQIALFDDIIPETIPCHRCNHQDAETPGFIRRWRRTNLWKGHDYFYDSFAVRQPTTSGPSDVRKMQESRNRLPGNSKTTTEPYPNNRGLPNIRRKRAVGDPTGANLRNVWSISPQPYKGRHFAAFPEEIPRKCVLAGTSQHGVCNRCGAPWARTTSKTFVPQEDVSPERGIKGAQGQKPMAENNNWDGVPRGANQVVTLGWRPTCSCNTGTHPATVLDPFAGSGTTLAVAGSLGRQSIGLDLSVEYLKLAQGRIGPGPTTPGTRIPDPISLEGAS